MSSDVDIDGCVSGGHRRLSHGLPLPSVATVMMDRDVVVDGEVLDPRIKVKLEELNECTNKINRLEKQFEVRDDNYGTN